MCFQNKNNAMDSEKAEPAPLSNLTRSVNPLHTRVKISFFIHSAICTGHTEEHVSLGPSVSAFNNGQESLKIKKKNEIKLLIQKDKYIV